MDTYLQNAVYDAVGRTELLTLTTNLQIDYGYYGWTQNGGRLQFLKAGSTSNPTALQDLSYTYDAGGNILSIVNTKANPSETQTFTYDSLERLQTTQLSTDLYPTEYTYDATGNILSEITFAGTTSYTYNDPAHKHAVKTVSNGTSYVYDANGNATNRTDNGQSFNLAYDAENRLISVSGAASANFRYAGDGTRLAATQGGVTNFYVGTHYEWRYGNIKKYYYAGAQRLAMRENNTLYYLVGDHLGSTSVVANASGGFYSELRYTAWGETRYSSGTMPTDFRFTGQRQTQGAGLEWLYYYNARWYDPTVGRFLQADTVIPEPNKGQAYNRYTYVNNNPLRYVDPSGHDWIDAFWFLGGIAHQAVTSAISGAALGIPTLTGAEQAYTDLQTDNAGAHAAAFTEGRVVGGLAGMAIGLAEIATGLAMIGGGSAGAGLTCLQTAGLGCIAGGGIALAGVYVAAAGVATTLVAGSAVVQSIATLASSGGQSSSSSNSNNTSNTNNNRRLIYEESPKHHPNARGNVSKAPTNGQAVLDNSIQVKSTSPVRVGVDPATGEYVVFSITRGNIYHGHVRTWKALEREMQNVLIEAGLVTSRGKIITP